MIHLHQVVNMEKFTYKMVEMSLRDVWKCVIVDNGRQCAIMTGAKKRQQLYADNLDDSLEALSVKLCDVIILLFRS